jgi:2-dehydropantoate 2-reductase
MLAEVLGPERLLIGATLMGGVILEPGLVMRSDIKNTHLASWTTGNEVWLARIAEMLNHAGLPTVIENNVNSLLWSKLSIHAGLNAVTAITRANNRQFLETPEAVRLAKMIVAEVVAVATAAGIPLLYSNCAQEMLVYAEAMKGHHSPMLQDILHQKKTEVSVLNSPVVKEGRRHGIPTPINEAVVLAVNTIESLYSIAGK